MSDYIRNTYTVLRYELDGVPLTDRIVVEPETDHDALVAERIDALFGMYPDIAIESSTLYMNERVYVDTTVVAEEPVVEGE